METVVSKLITLRLTEDEARQIIEAIDHDEWNAVEPLKQLYASLLAPFDESSNGHETAVARTRVHRPFQKARKRGRVASSQKPSKGSQRLCAVCGQPVTQGHHHAKRRDDAPAAE